MNKPLLDWSRHLDLISAGAIMCARHARQLRLRPGFAALAESDLKICEQTLAAALADVRKALERCGGKPEERS